MVYKLRNFDDRHLCWILLLDRTSAKRIFNFQSQIGQNSWDSEYRCGRQHSHLSDGPLNGSNRLAICELWQSETRPVAKTAFLADQIFLYTTGSWRNFAMTSPKTSHMKNFSNEFSFPLVTHTTDFNIQFGCYSIWIPVSVLDRLWIGQTVGVQSGFWTTRWIRVARV
jgi:hypothetical protein